MTWANFECCPWGVQAVVHLFNHPQHKFGIVPPAKKETTLKGFCCQQKIHVLLPTHREQFPNLGLLSRAAQTQPAWGGWTHKEQQIGCFCLSAKSPDEQPRGLPWKRLWAQHGHGMRESNLSFTTQRSTRIRGKKKLIPPFILFITRSLLPI